jgi:hypothetical protein
VSQDLAASSDRGLEREIEHAIQQLVASGLVGAFVEADGRLAPVHEPDFSSSELASYWFLPTQAGYAASRDCASLGGEVRLDDDALGEWILDVSHVTRRVEIRAKSEERAEQVLAWWISRLAGARLTSKRVEELESFGLRDGTVVAPAVTVVASYEIDET